MDNNERHILNKISRISKKKWTAIVCGLIVLFAAIFITAALVRGRNKPAVQSAKSDNLSSADTASASDESAETVYLNGQMYIPRNDLTTVLFLGIDSEKTDEYDLSQAFGGRSDVNLLFVLDDTNKTIQCIEISRDSMIDVDIYDANGEYLTSSRYQLTLQYSYGKTARQGCRLTADKISEILYGIKINARASLLMTGIPDIVDAIGGIQITIPQDYTDIDPSFTRGASLRLDGQQAYKYIRYRDTARFATNNERMERQVQIMRAAASQIKGSEMDTLQKAQKAAGDYLYSDLDAETLQKLSSYTLLDDFIKLPGKDVDGEHNEYHLDYSAIRTLVIQQFYQPAEKTQ